MLKVTVNPDRCIASKQCVATAEAAFRINPARNCAEVYNPAGADDATFMAAAYGCPTQAILVVDAATGRKLWPNE